MLQAPRSTLHMVHSVLTTTTRQSRVHSTTTPLQPKPQARGGFSKSQSWAGRDKAENSEETGQAADWCECGSCAQWAPSARL